MRCEIPLQGSSRGGLLLCNTVEGAESPDQRLTWDADDAPVREKRLQDTERVLIVRMIVGWNEHDAIGDVEIGITGG